jgi:hypothetical protein
MAHVPRKVRPVVGKFSSSRLNWIIGGARKEVSAKQITRKPRLANEW